MKCKNCEEEIYLSGHEVWYHKKDDNDICNATKPVNFKTLFDKAEPLEDSPNMDIQTILDKEKGCGKYQRFWQVNCGQMEDLKHSDHIIFCDSCKPERKVGERRT